jgi:HAE1 family hydrophobic/amphiphilic exporter-1
MLVANFTKRNRDENFLANYNNLYVKDVWCEGVGDVTAFGQPFSMRVWLDANKLANLSMTADVSTAIAEQTPAYRVVVWWTSQESSTVFEYPIITDSDLSNPGTLKTSL